MSTGVYKRKPFTEEHRRNMSKNHSRFWLGKKQSKEHKEKISKSLIGNTRSLGNKQSQETILKSRVGRKKNGWYKNRDLTIEKHRKSKIGKKRKPFSKEWRRKLGDTQRGEKSRFWKGGITPQNKLLRQSIDLKDWRNKIFKRDNYTCMICLKRGVYLEAHHIKTWSKYPELRFEIGNGVTLCKICHNKTKWKEELYEQNFLKNGGKFILESGEIVG
jgi:hypothetical protein